MNNWLIRLRRQRFAPVLPLPRLLPLLLLLCLLASLPLGSQSIDLKRDNWQRPEEVMDALGIEAGSAVADVGAGDGYFTFHLARRVGPTGRVYAVEIKEHLLASIRRRAEREKLTQVETVLGAPDDPHLPPASLDAVLIVNAYHEMREYDAMLAALFRALKPGGRLSIIEAADKPGRKREDYFSRHRVPAALAREDAARAGFRFLREEPGFTRPRDTREFYFVLFVRPE